MKVTSTGTLRINFRDFLPEDRRRVRCGYRCSYCNQSAVEQVALTESDLHRARGIWDKMGAIEDRLLVRANFDGEIFADHWAREICFYVATLAHVSRFEFVTNNAMDPDAYGGRIDPCKTVFNCSFHPEFTSIDAFIGRMRKIRSRGSEAFATMVVTPLRVRDLARTAARFRDEGILFKPLLLLGRYQPGVPDKFKRAHKNICQVLGIRTQYPRAYSSRALDVIRAHYYSDMEFEHQNGKTVKGEPCWAGVDMVNVFMDGTVMRCFGEKLGSVDDLVAGRLTLAQKPYSCPFETCQCPAHMIFLDRFRQRFLLHDDFVDHYHC